MNTTVDIGMIERQLDRVQAFVPRIDARVTAYIAIITGQMALVLTNVSAKELSGWFMVLCLIGYIASAAWGIVNLYQCLHPNLEGGEKSLIYFGEIARLEEDKFLANFLALDDDALRKEFLRQIWRNSQIVLMKYMCLKRAGSSMLIGALPWAILLLGSSLHNYSFPTLP